MEQSLQRWFVQEIVKHEAALMSYIRRAWPDREEAADIRQEIYAKIFESAAKARPAQPRHYLFTTARNLIVDRVRRGKIVSIEMRDDLDEYISLVDELSPERHEGARQELRRLIGAFESLPPVFRETIWKRKVEELSQKDVAAAMGTKERVVQRRLSRGIRLLAESFLGAADKEQSSGFRANGERGGGSGEQDRKR
jgi:RNA polymerase sigma factor (sigma-70 family)